MCLLRFSPINPLRGASKLFTIFIKWWMIKRQLDLHSPDDFFFTRTLTKARAWVSEGDTQLHNCFYYYAFYANKHFGWKKKRTGLIFDRLIGGRGSKPQKYLKKLFPANNEREKKNFVKNSPPELFGAGIN